jgi:hypothetical protein
MIASDGAYTTLVADLDQAARTGRCFGSRHLISTSSSSQEHQKRRLTDDGRRGACLMSMSWAIPLTAVLPYGEEQGKHDRAVLALLTEQSAGQPWWLGYLDTGADDIVFSDAPMATLYSGWHYVLAQAGPEQAATWRESSPWSFWKGALPNLMFPADRSWLVSTLWDDDWTCLGGPAELVDGFLRHPGLRARAVALGQDATPPGHQAF